MIRFIHAADIHLDSLMQGLNTKQADIDPAHFRLSTRHALSNLVDWVLEKQVDFLTLGGDNYDGDWKDYHTGLYFIRQITRLDGIPVVSIAGNHDAQSKMTRSLRLPSFFHQLSDIEPEIKEVIPGVRVAGQSFPRQSETRNLAREYPALDGHGVKIGLLHTSLAGGTRDGHDNYAPCSLDDLRFKQYHFWGLGHIHKHSWQNEQGDCPILYPGNLQGRHIRETGAKGAFLITLSDDGEFISQEFKALDTSRWEELIVDISHMTRLDDFWLEIDVRFRNLIAQSDDRFLAVRVRIIGNSEIHPWLVKMANDGDQSLHTEVQNSASKIINSKIWVEKTRLESRSPRSLVRNTQAMLALKDYIQKASDSEDWISGFLNSREMEALRKNASTFRDEQEASQINQIFDVAGIKELIQSIPEMLEVNLNQ